MQWLRCWIGASKSGEACSSKVCQGRLRTRNLLTDSTSTLYVHDNLFSCGPALHAVVFSPAKRCETQSLLLLSTDITMYFLSAVNDPCHAIKACIYSHSQIGPELDCNRHVSNEQFCNYCKINTSIVIESPELRI